MMPALNALPGLSPICWTVREQMEHWAFVCKETRLREITSSKIKKPNFLTISQAFRKTTLLKDQIPYLFREITGSGRCRIAAKKKSSW